MRLPHKQKKGGGGGGVEEEEEEEERGPPDLLTRRRRGLPHRSSHTPSVFKSHKCNECEHASSYSGVIWRRRKDKILDCRKMKKVFQCCPRITFQRGHMADANPQGANWRHHYCRCTQLKEAAWGGGNRRDTARNTMQYFGQIQTRWPRQGCLLLYCICGVFVCCSVFGNCISLHCSVFESDTGPKPGAWSPKPSTTHSCWFPAKECQARVALFDAK